MSEHPVASLLGDVIGSRARGDQPGLLEAVAAACEQVNAAVDGRQPLQVTVGDELQGTFATVGAALEAAVRLRAELAWLDDPVELRVGLGWGRAVPSGAGEPPLGQSGAAWWTAREALEAVGATRGAAHWPRTRRSAFRGDEGLQAPVDALLVCLDELLGRFDRGDWRILVGLMDGRRQVDLAEELGISQPSVARREQDRGISAAYRALGAVRGLAPGTESRA